MVIDGVSTAQVRAATTGGGTNELDRDAFLKLLVAQLRNQDPLNPLDNTEFTAQLAQFSALERLTNMDSKLADLVSRQDSLQNTLALTLIGRNVEVADSTFTLDGEGAELGYVLAEDAAAVKISIYDSSGRLVREETIHDVPAGRNSFAWDGTDGSGEAVAPGTYLFTVDAVDAAGETVGAETLVSGRVVGLTFDGGTAQLVLEGNQRIPLGKIVTITEGGA